MVFTIASCTGGGRTGSSSFVGEVVVVLAVLFNSPFVLVPATTPFSTTAGGGGHDSC